MLNGVVAFQSQASDQIGQQASYNYVAFGTHRLSSIFGLHATFITHLRRAGMAARWGAFTIINSAWRSFVVLTIYMVDAPSRIIIQSLLGAICALCSCRDGNDYN
jgi:hypothetical protein